MERQVGDVTELLNQIRFALCDLTAVVIEVRDALKAKEAGNGGAVQS